MPEKIIEDVNALLNHGVGDPYRLEHIKQTYLKNKTIWSSDEKYLDFLREKYLRYQKPTSKTEPIPDEKSIHCWKCGVKNKDTANYCNNCGISLHKVGEPKEEEKKVEQPAPKKPKKEPRESDSGKKIAIAGIAALVIAIITAAAVLGGDYIPSFDNSDKPIPKPTVTQQSVDSGNSKCGSGTVFDETTNSCVLESMLSSSESDDSKCGSGTVYDEATNSCVLESMISEQDSGNSKCGLGTVFDPKTNSCVLG